MRDKGDGPPSEPIGLQCICPHMEPIWSGRGHRCPVKPPAFSVRVPVVSVSLQVKQFGLGAKGVGLIRFAVAKMVHRDRLSVRFGLAMDASSTAPILPYSWDKLEIAAFAVSLFLIGGVRLFHLRCRR